MILTLFCFFQVHPAPAFSRFTRYRIAVAGSAAVAEVNSGARKAHPFYRGAAQALAWIIRVQTPAFAPLIALAEYHFIALDLEDMPPFQGCSARAISRFGADRVAFALGTAVACVQHVLAFRFHCGLLHRRTPGDEKCQKDPGNEQFDHFHTNSSLIVWMLFTKPPFLYCIIF